LVYPGAEELFLDELARGDAEMAPEPVTSPVHWRRICRSCRALS
jgi:hypothetical protein